MAQTEEEVLNPNAMNRAWRRKVGRAIGTKIVGTNNPLVGTKRKR